MTPLLKRRRNYRNPVTLGRSSSRCFIAQHTCKLDRAAADRGNRPWSAGCSLRTQALFEAGVDRRPGAVRFGISNSSAELAILQRRSAEPGRRPRFHVAGPWRGSPARRRGRATGRSNRENRGAGKPDATPCADRPVSPFPGSMNFEYHPSGDVGKREPQIILQTDERSAVLELGWGKFVA